jgi:DNA replication protein DnaC
MTDIAHDINVDMPYRDRYIEVAAAAHERCDNAFPRRYLTAHTELPEVIDWVKQFRADAANAPSLLLLGPTGTGKTWQAYAALRQAVTYPQPARGVGYRAPGWKATTHADLLASMRPSPRNDSEQVLKEYRELPLLFVDDLGVAKNSEWVEDITYRLINGRYEQMMPSIFTSNLAVNQLKDALGDRVASRLAETTIRVVLNGADRRRAPKEA